MNHTHNTILIVEDDRNMAQALALKFRSEGCEPTLSYDGEEATDRLKDRRFDVVLLDILLPSKNGFNVLEELPKTVNSATPVTVLTCLGQEETLSKARSLGARQCFVKSQVQLSDVVQAIKKEIGAQSD